MTKPKKTPTKTTKAAVKKPAAKTAVKKPVKAAAAKPQKSDPGIELAKKIAQLAYDTKAENIEVLDLSKLAAFAKYFVICSGKSDRQVQAIAYNVEKGVKEDGARPLSVEGYQEGHWILIDFVDVVVHVFYEETRDFYALEKFWGDAPRVKLKLK